MPMQSGYQLTKSVFLFIYLLNSLYNIVMFFYKDAMNSKSKQTLQRYLSKLDRGDPGVPEEVEIDARLVAQFTFIIYNLYKDKV